MVRNRNIYNPGEAYWREVAELDETLFNRGRAHRGILSGVFVVGRSTIWLAGGEDYALKSYRTGRLLGGQYGRYMRSHLCYFQAVSTGPTDRIERGREVIYNPRDRGGYVFRDYQFTLDNVDFIETGDDGAGNKEIKFSVRREMREQRKTGFCLPTEETFGFVLDALRRGEELTQ